MSEEYAEGKEIYDEQFNNLNEEDFYNPQEEVDS